MDFEDVAAVALIATVVAALAHALFIGPKRSVPLGRRRPRYSAIIQVIHAVLALSFLALAATGLTSAFLYDALTGWFLWFHMISAGIFLFSLTLSVLLWAAPAANLPASPFNPAQKRYFWLLTTLGLATVTPILLSMLPLIGTDGQRLLVELHAYAALALTVATLWHIYVATFVKRGALRSMVGGDIDVGVARTLYPEWQESAVNPPE